MTSTPEVAPAASPSSAAGSSSGPGAGDADAHDLSALGYDQQLHRSLGKFASFAAGFSFVSILTTIFQFFGFGYSFGGAAFFWTVPSILASVPALRAAAPWLGGFDDTATAIAAGILLFILPGRGRTQMLLDWKDAEEGLPWGVLLLFGGGLSLSSVFNSSGLSLWIGEMAKGLSVLPVVLIVSAVAALVLFLTEITSNTATAATFIPIMGGVAVGVGLTTEGDINVLLLTIPVALAATCAFMLPVATPPNAIAYGSGYVKIGEMIKGGVGLNVIGIFLITLTVFLLAVPIFGLTV